MGEESNLMFEPGKTLKTFTSKKGNAVVLRLAKSDDLAAMTDYINNLSLEDTFVSFSGEQLTLEEEKKFLDEALEKMQKVETICLVAMVGNDLIGIAGIDRLTRRSKHVGSMGLSIKKEYRGEGIGKVMLQTVLDLGKQMGLRFVELSCFANNQAACSLYKSVGFEEVGRIPEKYFYKESYIDAIIMTKKL